jgi:hypothetical protein
MIEDRGLWKWLVSTIIRVPRGFREFIIGNIILIALVVVVSYLNLQYPWNFALLVSGAVVYVFVLLHAAYSGMKGN